jgi:hypothetical protein
MGLSKGQQMKSLHCATVGNRRLGEEERRQALKAGPLSMTTYSDLLLETHLLLLGYITVYL